MSTSKEHAHDAAATWPRAGDTYRHFKGGEYQVVCCGPLEGDPGTVMVAYRPLTAKLTGTPIRSERVWFRTLANFLEEVDRDGYRGPRFYKETAAEAARRGFSGDTP